MAHSRQFFVGSKSLHIKKFAVKARGTANAFKFVSANFGGKGASTKQFQKGELPLQKAAT